MKEIYDLPILGPLRMVFGFLMLLPVFFPIAYLLDIIPALDLFEGGAYYIMIAIFTVAAILSLIFGFYVSNKMKKKLRGKPASEIITGLGPIYAVNATAFSAISTWGVIVAIFGVEKPIALAFFVISIIFFVWYFPTRTKMENQIARLSEPDL